MNRLIVKLAGALCLVFAVSTAARADALLKFDLNGVGPDIAFNNGVLATMDDGDASTAGDQKTNIIFVGALDSLVNDVVSGASFSLAGVTATGTPNVQGDLISQLTNDGSFSIYGASNTLLLKGQLGSGLITGSEAADTGSFFNTQNVSYTDGSLVQYVSPANKGISLALAAILSSYNGSNVSGLRVADGALANFTASATGLLSGNAGANGVVTKQITNGALNGQSDSGGPTPSVPEPATAALLLAGLLGGFARRRSLK